MEDINYLRTLVILHNGNAPWNYQYSNAWYIRAPDGPRVVHEVEQHKYDRHRNTFFWRSERDAIIAYLTYYNLGGYGGNDGPECTRPSS